ncbi:8618_t:CDS:2 [Funneliformis geosporum]|nr:8618_t:CDS:2 [Funneliformis geosporum]
MNWYELNKTPGIPRHLEAHQFKRSPFITSTFSIDAHKYFFIPRDPVTREIVSAYHFQNHFHAGFMANVYRIGGGYPYFAEKWLWEGIVDLLKR